MGDFPAARDIERAAERIRPYIHHTPIHSSDTISGMVGAEILFKCENLQKVGAFKYRGASNAVHGLDEATAARGVATHSSGNHAQALALAARVRGIPAYIVMPENAPAVKIRAVEGYGAQITFCRPTLQAREDTLAAVVARTGAVFVHPYDDWRIITGQATAAKEMLENRPDVDLILAPVGGGGLLSGTALAAHYFSSTAEVIAAEPEGADDAMRSFRAGHIVPSVQPDTIADGLLTSLGKRNFAVIRQHVRDIVSVDDDAIRQAMRLVWERMKLIIEPSAAVPLAAVLEGRIDVRGRVVGIILSGGNVDLDALPWQKGNT
ncbi:pyridoxal-phosphate dependent enzyme [bacterium]|nr:pyridoxal-phosphate dependent enzyme [bacterium]